MGEWQRRLFHLLGTSIAPVTALLLPRETFLICLGATAIAFLIVEWVRLIISPSFNQRLILRFRLLLRQQETYQIWGSTYIVLSSLVVFLLFEKEIAIVALFFLAVGDPVAGVIGANSESRRLWTKSLEGTVACFLSCFVLGICLANTILPIGLAVILAGSLGAALAELLPLPVNDNFTIPLLAAVAMSIAGLVS